MLLLFVVLLFEAVLLCLDLSRGEVMLAEMSLLRSFTRSLMLEVTESTSPSL